MYSTVKLEAIRDPDLNLEQIQRMMRTIFINHSERLSVTKKNPESNRYQGSNRKGRENGRESAMSTNSRSCQLRIDYLERMGKVLNGNQKGHKRFRELRHTPYIKCLVHVPMYFVFKKNEMSDKIVLYIFF